MPLNDIASHPSATNQQKAVAEEFDQYNESYEDTVNESLSFANMSVDGFVKAKADDFIRVVRSEFDDMTKVRALDVGCGVGIYHSFFKPHIGSLSGIDVSAKSVARAKERNPEVNYQTYDGSKLPYADNSFDVISCICVMHHVPEKQWPTFLAEMLRVVTPDGLCIVYEHNPWNPLTLKVVKDCPFDKDAVLLSALHLKALFAEAKAKSVSSRFMLTLPPWGKAFSALDRVLGWLPTGTQYRTIARPQ